MGIWSKILFIVGFWTLFAIPSAFVLGFIFCKLDRHPKDGPHCRKCDFDLRATAGESCTECGATFKPRGVWPPGKPSRKRLAVLISIWTWFVVSFAISIHFFYTEYEYDFIQRGYMDTHCASLNTPKSDAFSEVVIFDSGTELRLFPDQYDFPNIKANQVVIWLETREFELIVCAFDLATGKVVRPEGPTVDTTLSYAKHFSSDQEPHGPVDYLISMLKTENASIGNEEAVRAELIFLVELAKEISEAKADATDWDDLETSIKSVLDASDYQRYFAFAAPNNSTEHYYYPVLPLWVVYVPPIIFFAIWGAGVLVLRFVFYRRQAVDAIPASA